MMDVFGVLAALLAAAGIIGVTARSVSMRVREMGIRMALGAPASELVGAAVRENLAVVAAGTGIGLAGGFWFSKLLSGFLFGIRGYDPPTYLAVSSLVIVLALLASYLPARCIEGIDPAQVLKAD